MPAERLYCEAIEGLVEFALTAAVFVAAAVVVTQQRTFTALHSKEAPGTREATRRKGKER